VHLLLASLRPVFESHDPIITLLARHQLGDHGTILLVDRAFVDIGTADRAAFVADMVFGVGDLGELKFVSAIVIRTHFARDVVAGEHRVVESDTTLRRVTLALVFVVVDAVDVDNALVVLP